jgi:hypothetical protein
VGFNLAEAIVFLKTDDSQLDKGLDAAEKKTGSAVGNMAKMFGGALVAGAAVATTAIIGIGTEAFNVASDIDAATDQIGASLGLNGEKAKAFGQTIKDIYANNFGDSIADVGAAVESVAKGLRLTAEDPALKVMTENAFRLRDVFGVDVADSIDAVKTLTEQFGITSDEAFGMLADGYQLGMDRSGDFLDTIGEYSVQFAEGGASANNFFSTLLSGMQGGMLGTDKAADAFKEFRVRIQDGSTLTADSLKMIGLNADEMAAGFADGSITAIDAFNQVTRALQETDDANIQFQAGVGLIGTQFEDLGASVITNIDPMADAFDAMSEQAGTLDTKYSNLGSVFEGMWRQFQVGIAPAGEAMLVFVNDNLPMLQGMVNTVSGAISNMVGSVLLGITALRTGWEEDWGGMRTATEKFSEEMPVALQGMWDEINLLFGREESEMQFSWELFWGNMWRNATTRFVYFIEVFTGLLRVLRTALAVGSAFIDGDWEAFWGGLYDEVEAWGDLLMNEIEFSFGLDIRNAMGNALQGMWDAAEEKLNAMRDWWNSAWGTFRDILPFSEPKDPASPFRNLGDSGAAMIDNFQKGMDSRLSELVGIGGSTNSTNYSINVNMAGGGYESGFAAGEGILEAMRFRGA